MAKILTGNDWTILRKTFDKYNRGELSAEQEPQPAALAQEEEILLTPPELTAIGIAFDNLAPNQLVEGMPGLSQEEALQLVDSIYAKLVD